MWTSEQQIKRLLRPGSTYFNLNPYEVSVCVIPLAGNDAWTGVRIRIGESPTVGHSDESDALWLLLTYAHSVHVSTFAQGA